MDNRRLVLVLLLLMPLFLFWGPLVDTFYKKMGWQIPQPATQPADVANATSTSAPSTWPTTGFATSITAGTGPAVVTPAISQSPVSSMLGSAIVSGGVEGAGRPSRNCTKRA